MQIRLIKFFILVLLYSVNASVFASNANLKLYDSSLAIGWYPSKPYQYTQSEKSQKVLGLDSELVNIIASKIGKNIEYNKMSWHNQLAALKSGQLDIVFGASLDDFGLQNRSNFAVHSKIYRYQEDSIFLKDHNKLMASENIQDILASIRLQNFRLGVIKDYIYNDVEFNIFSGRESNKDIIYNFANEVQALEALIQGSIDGFAADRAIGSTLITEYNGLDRVEEIKIGKKTPIALLINKNNVSPEIIEKINIEIDNLVNSKEYKSIFKKYLYPLMLIHTVKSNWFYLMGMIGSIAFAVSGVMIALRERINIFGVFILAMLPSVTGNITRDLLINNDEIELFLTPSFIYYIIFVVFIGYVFAKITNLSQERVNSNSMLAHLIDKILIVADSIGQAAFIVTGVSVAIVAKIEPIALWGPFLAFLTANGGLILRDLISESRRKAIFKGPISYEITIIWGILFSLYLHSIAVDPDQDNVIIAVILVFFGAIMSQIFCSIILRVKNIYF